MDETREDLPADPERKPKFNPFAGLIPERPDVLKDAPYFLTKLEYIPDRETPIRSSRVDFVRVLSSENAGYTRTPLPPEKGPDTGHFRLQLVFKEVLLLKDGTERTFWSVEGDHRPACPWIVCAADGVIDYIAAHPGQAEW